MEVHSDNRPDVAGFIGEIVDVVPQLCLALLAAFHVVPASAQVPPPVGTAALATGEFTGKGDPSAAPVATGLGDLIFMEAVNMLDGAGSHAGCPAVFVEWRRRRMSKPRSPFSRPTRSIPLRG